MQLEYSDSDIKYTEEVINQPTYGRLFYENKKKDVFRRDITGITYDDITIPIKNETFLMNKRFDSDYSKDVFLKSLTKEQLYYRENGYVILENFVSSDTIDEYLELRDSMKLKSNDGFPDYTPYVEHKVIRELCCSEKLNEILISLHGELMGCIFNLSKMVSTQRGWHQDSYLDDEYAIPRCATFLALGDIKEDCGPFEYVPTSNNWESLSRKQINSFLREEFRWPDNHPSWSSLSEPYVDPACLMKIKESKKPIKRFMGKKGDLLIWYGRLMHRGSPPKRVGAERPGLITHYGSVQEITRKKNKGNFFKHGNNGGFYYVPYDKCNSI